MHQRKTFCNRQDYTGASDMSKLNIKFEVINPLNHDIPSVRVNPQPNTVGRVKHIERGVMALDYTKGKALSINRN